MSFLVRKVSRAKWPNDKLDIIDFPGDLFADLRTTENTLSLWKIESLEELHKAIVALAVAPQNKAFDKIDVVWIDEKQFEDAHIPIDDSRIGQTAATDFADLHRDLYGITYSSLGEIAKIISQSILDNHHKRVVRKDVMRYVRQALEDGVIDETMCDVALLQMIKS